MRRHINTSKPTLYLLVLRKKWTDFHNIFCPTHCTTPFYTDILLYLVKIQPENRSTACTVSDEEPLTGQLKFEDFRHINCIVQ
jgi:hypothetical protein